MAKLTATKKAAARKPIVTNRLDYPVQFVNYVKTEYKPYPYASSGQFTLVDTTDRTRLPIKSVVASCTDYLCEEVQRYEPTRKPYRLVYFSNAMMVDKVKTQVLPFLNRIEKRNKLKRTRIVELKNHNVVFVTDRRWITNSMMISLLSKLIRNLMVHTTIENLYQPKEFQDKFWSIDTELNTPLLQYAIYGGKVLDIIKDDKTPHGLTGSVPGHSNAGIMSTLAMGPALVERTKNLKSLQQELLQQIDKGVSLHEMPSL